MHDVYGYYLLSRTRPWISIIDLAGHYVLCRNEIRAGMCRHQLGVLGVFDDQVVYILGLLYHMNCSDDRA
jgi:hypothetical protein